MLDSLDGAGAISSGISSAISSPIASPIASSIGSGSQSALLPSSEAFTVRIFEGLRAVSLHHLGGGAVAIETALSIHNLSRIPRPGIYEGNDPWLVWTGPAKMLLLTSNDAIADGVMRALAPGNERLACAVDQSAGCVVFDLLGAGVDDVLHRLMDASAIPVRAPHAVRAKLIDISAVFLRLHPKRALLAVDRPHVHFAASWMDYAWRAAATPP